jgi:hypothetical protein
MKRGVTNFGASVRARLLAVAQKENVQFEYILLRYALERFLYRLGSSISNRHERCNGRRLCVKAGLIKRLVRWRRLLIRFGCSCPL